MLKYRLITLILFTALISSQAYSQVARTVSGLVSVVDPNSGLLSVKIDDVTVVFYLTSTSSIHMAARDMSILDIAAGDPVTIKYVDVTRKKYIISLVDNKKVNQGWFNV